MKQLSLCFLVLMSLISCVEAGEEPREKQQLSAQNKSTQLLAQKITPGIPKGFIQRDYCMDAGKYFAYTTIMLPNGRRSFLLEIDLKAGKASLLPFSGVYKDLEPMLSPDDQKLMFASNRPLFEGDSTRDFNLWYVERTEEGWSTAIPFDSTINTPADEFYPSMNNKGDLYFTAIYPGRSKDDLYMSMYTDSGYTVSERLSFCGNNSYEFNGWVSPDNQYMLFSALGYPDELGGGDLYRVQRDSNENWNAPELLGPKANTSGLDYSPFVLHDTLYFTSKRMDERWIEKQFKYMVEIKMMADSTGIGEQGVYFLPLAAALSSK